MKPSAGMSSTLLLADVAFTVALVGLTVVALSRSATRGGDIALAATGNTLSPEAIHRTIDVAKLPVQQIDDMSVVFSDSAPRAP